jgi:hypothetical protein
MLLSASTQTTLAYFPVHYNDARDRFRALARHRGAKVTPYPITAAGPDGQALTIDTAYLGAAQPRRLLILCSGTHGVEGFAGSALQQQWLEGFTAARQPAHAGCLLIHALNPYGFAWLRRTNENNVDLNRNALERFPGPSNSAYRRLDAWLNPPSAPKFPELFLLHGAVLAVRHGFASLQQAVVEGQYEFPRGLFYGGERVEESIEVLRKILSDDAWSDIERVVMIDLHTGIGRFATYKLMVDAAPDSEPYRDMTKWFGSESLASNRPADSIAYRVSGGLNEQVTRLFAPRPVYAAVLEFGAAPPVRTLAALRRENRAYHYASATGRVLQQAREELRTVFCPSASEWRTQVLADGARVLAQAERACFTPK